VLASNGMQPIAARRPTILEVTPYRLDRWFLRVAALGLLVAAHAGMAAPESFGLRQSPLALSPEYGDIAFSDPGTGTGTMVVSTREGIEVRAASSPKGDPIGIYRAPGVVLGMALSGARAYLFQGDLGITRLDLTDPSNPIVAATVITPSSVRMGAILADGSCVAASDSFVHVCRLESGGDLSLLQTLAYTDGRLIRRVRAHGDSILVVAARPGVLPRLFATIYRLPAGATSVTKLVEWISNGKDAQDAVWTPPMAFIADGSTGIYPLNTATGVFGATVSYANGLLVRALGATDADLFAVGEAATLQRFARTGAQGETLQPQTVESLELEPVSVAVDGTRAFVTTRDVLSAVDPDEPGRSQIEFPLSSSAPPPPTTPIRHIGRSRRIVIDAGLAYVADFTGGLRIYRAGSSDTSLVGVLPPTANARTVDLALDPSQSRVYLASGAGGLEVVDVTDPASPQRMSSLLVPGLASAVTVINASTVAVAHRGTAGVTFVDVSTPTAPVARGSVSTPDPRALAARDTVLFVADHQLGLLSIGFGNLDAPALFGTGTQSGARDLDLQGTLLLVATRSMGVLVVDVFQPASAILRSTVFLPPVLGVTRNGSTAIACLGAGGVALIDVSTPGSAYLRSIVAAAGLPRDAAWVGDSLLVAGGTSIDRFDLAAAIPTLGGLLVSLDPASVLPRAYLSWTLGSASGQVGWNLYREVGPRTSGSQSPGGTRLNERLLASFIRSIVDDEVVAGAENRYRLEAAFGDGRLLTVAEGSFFAPSGSRLGRPYPNPFRSADGGVTVPYRAAIAGGSVTLRVVDVRGRLVREITSPAPVSGGFGAVVWDGRNGDGRRIPSGVYYLYVRGQGIDDARSVVHLR